MGTPQELTNEQGEMVWLNYEFAWGGSYQNYYKEQSINGIVIDKDHLQPLKFQGQFFDQETSLHYNRFRYYDSDVGMFIQRDPIGLLGGWNVYQYVINPSGFIDPFGLSYFRGAKEGQNPSFKPRPNDYKIDSNTGLVKDTHGVSIFDNAESVYEKGFIPHEIDVNSIPDTLDIKQRGKDPKHFEITPKTSDSLTPKQYADELDKIKCH